MCQVVQREPEIPFRLGSEAGVELTNRSGSLIDGEELITGQSLQFLRLFLQRDRHLYDLEDPGLAINRFAGVIVVRVPEL